MARTSLTLGFVETVLISPGIHEEVTTERSSYVADILKNEKQYSDGESINKERKLLRRYSIVMDDYAMSHHPQLEYVITDGIKWAVSTIEVQRPRLILTTGGRYNG